METNVTTASFSSSVAETTRGGPATSECPPWSRMLPIHRTIYQLEVTMLGIIFALASVGNACVLGACWLRRAKQSRMVLFIFHLAIADLVVAFFQVLPEWLMRLLCGFHASDAACKFIKFMEVVGMYGSTYVLLCAAFDRYFAVCYPMQSLRVSRKRVYVSIVAAWCLALLMSSPQLFLFSLVGPRKCRTGMSSQAAQVYVTWSFFTLMLLPTLLLGYFYGMIALTIIRNIRSKKGKYNNVNHADSNQAGHEGDFAPRASSVGVISRAKLKTVKMTFVIVITFAVCWAPFFIVQLLGIWNAIDRNHAVSSVLHLMGSLNSCTNPWIYMSFSGNMLKQLRNYLCCKQQAEHEFTHTRMSEMREKRSSCVTEVTKIDNTTTSIESDPAARDTSRSTRYKPQVVRT